MAEILGAGAVALTGARHGAVYLRGSSPEEEPVRAWASEGCPDFHGTPGGRPLYVSDVQDLRPDDQLRAVAEHARCRAFAVWPLGRGERPAGSVVCWYEAPRAWQPEQVDAVSALTLQATAALADGAFEGASAHPEDAPASRDRIAEALRILEAESTTLSEAHRELEAQHGRLVQTRRELGAVSMWLLAVQKELAAERTHLAAEADHLQKARDELAAEDARVAAAREALDAQIGEARRQLEIESARLAEMGRDLFERRPPTPAARPDNPPPPLPRTVSKGPERPTARASLTDARRVLEEESARLMQALDADAAPSPDLLGPRQAPAPRPAETSGAATVPPPQETAEPGPAYELGGPLPVPRALEDLYPLLVERAAKLQNQEQRTLAAEEQLKVLGKALDDRDGHRAGYGERIEAWAEATAGMLGCGRDEIADVRRAALLHDLGKIGVPEAILRAHARLSEQQRRIVRSVPTLAEQVLRPVPGMKGVAAILRHRYEQWDGKGYPDGLKGEQIPLGARILAVADAYGVMTTVRPYRAMVYSLDAVAELRRCAGAQFDPRVVETFCSVLKREG